MSSRVLVLRGDRATAAWIWICSTGAKFTSYRWYLPDGSAQHLAFDVEDEAVAVELALRYS